MYALQIKGQQEAKKFKFVNISTTWEKKEIISKMAFVIVGKNPGTAIQIFSKNQTILKFLFLKQIKYIETKDKGIIIDVNSVEEIKEFFNLLELINIKLEFYKLYDNESIEKSTKEEYLQDARRYF